MITRQPGAGFYRIFTARTWKHRFNRLVAALEDAIAELLVIAIPAPRTIRSDCSIHMLISERSAAMGLLALRSLQRNLGFVCPVIFHDDGSLGEKASLLRRRAAPSAPVRIVSRMESDTLLFERTLERPATRAALDKWVFVRKYLAPYFYSPTDKYILLDSDVVFFRHPREVSRWLADPMPSWWFNKDCVYAYTHTTQELESAFGVHFWPHVNAGFALLDRKLFNFELAERYFRFVGSECSKHFWVEQTLYAVEASVHGQGGLLPPSYQVSYGNRLRKDAVSRHYIDNLKPSLFYRQGVTRFVLGSALQRVRDGITPPIVREAA